MDSFLKNEVSMLILETQMMNEIGGSTLCRGGGGDGSLYTCAGLTYMDDYNSVSSLFVKHTRCSYNMSPVSVMVLITR